MIEIVAAVFLPAVALLCIARCAGDGPLWRAVSRWFVPLVLVWFAPCWLTGRSPAPLPFLFAQVVPWKTAGVAVPNALLSDVVLQFLPWREVVTDAWLHGRLPLLDPHAGAGSALWANPVAAVLAPTTILGLPFSTFAWPLFAAVVKMFVALTGTFLFLRREGRSELAATFGAVAYAFCAFGTAYMLFPLTNVTTLLPWMMLAAGRAAEGRWSGAIFAAVVTFLLLVGGHPESVFHVALLAVPYALVQSHGRRSLAMLVWAAVVGFLLAAPVVLPFLRLLPSTARVAVPESFYRTPSLSARNVLPFVFPAHFAYSVRRVAQLSGDGANFSEVATQYAGFATFVLLIAGAAAAPRRHRFWIAAMAVLTLMAFGLVPVPLPVLHGRVRFLLAFITAVVAASAVDLEPEERRALPLIAGVALLIVLAANARFWGEYQALGIAPVVAASVAAAVASAVVLSRDNLRRLLPLVVFADLAVLGLAAHPPSGRALAYPRTPAIAFLERQPRPFRIVGLEGTLFPNTPAMFGLDDIRVHDPVAFEPYAAMLERGGLDRSGYFQVFRRLPSHALADRLGVRFIVAPPGTGGGLPVAYRGRDAVIFVNPTARGRFAIDRPAVLRVEPTGPDDFRVRVESTTAAEVTSGQAALPGWSLRRDGKPWPITPGPLLGWGTPPGKSAFTLRYRPAGFGAGIALAAIGISLLLHAVWLSAITRSSSASAA